MPNQNPFIWQELVTPDQKASGAFYGDLFGWTSKQVDAGEYGMYTIFKKDGMSIAGMMNTDSSMNKGVAAEASYWRPYIGVDDIQECIKQSIKLGGKVLMPAHHVPGEGWVGVIADPAGAVIHLKQPDK